MANIRSTFLQYILQYSSSCNPENNPEGFVECHFSASQRAARFNTDVFVPDWHAVASLLVQLFLNLFQTHRSCCLLKMVKSNPD